MLLCNYVFLPPLVPPLPFPSSVATVSPPSVFVLVVVIVVVVVVVIVVVHLVPCCWWQSLLALATRRAWRAVTPLALATVDPEEVDVASRHFQFRLRPLLRLLHCHDHDTVALHVPHTSFIPHLVLHRIISLLMAVGVPVHFHLCRTTCSLPQKRPFTGRTFFACISSALSSQATRRELLLRYSTPMTMILRRIFLSKDLEEIA